MSLIVVYEAAVIPVPEDGEEDLFFSSGLFGLVDFIFLDRNEETFREEQKTG